MAKRRRSSPDKWHGVPTQVVHECDGLPAYSVSLMERAQDLEKKLRGTSVLGIVGMAGIGKTMLAKQLFNNISMQFKYTCFVEDVKDWTPKSTLVRHVKESFYRRGSMMQSIGWHDLAGKKTLIVMDDVDSEEQLRFLPALHLLGEESVIVITTRNQDILKFFDECTCYEVDFLHPKDAERLFCHHAFRQDTIPDRVSTKRRADAQEVIAKCDGLPLTLEYLGRYLRCCEDDSTDWTGIIDEMGEASSITGNWNDKVWADLKESYDTLAEAEREMFIDIATFFVDEPLETALAAWSTVYTNPERRWANLVSRCLVKSRDDRPKRSARFQKIWMHEHLRDLGIKLSRSSQNNLDEDKKVVPQHRRLRFQMFDIPETHFKRLKFLALDFVSFHDPSEMFPSNLSFLRWLGPPEDAIPFPIMVAEMTKLAVLELSNFQQVQPLKFPHELRVLKLSNIEGLDQLPKDFGTLPWLKVLELESLKLTELPEFLGHLSALGTLVLRECPNLEKLPNSLGSLASLQLLIMSLVNLGTLPDNFGQLAALKKFDMDAPEMESLPESFVLLTCLQTFKLHSQKIRKLPENFGQLQALRNLDVDAQELASLPDSFSLLRRLQRFKLCSGNIPILPVTFWQLEGLTVLDLMAKRLNRLPLTFHPETLQELLISSGELQRLPVCFDSLSGLRKLTLETPKLGSLPESFGGLTFLTTFRSYGNLQNLPVNFGLLKALENLDLDFPNMVMLPESFVQLSSLRRLILKSSLRGLPESFGELSFLEHLDLASDNLTCLPESIGNLSSLRTWYLRTRNLNVLPESVGELLSLKDWALDESSLTCFPDSIGNLSALERWDVWASSLICLPHSIGNLSSLKEWSLHAEKLLELPESIGNLSALERWSVDASSVIDLPHSIGNLSSLKEWSLHAEKLLLLPQSIGDLSALQRLSVDASSLFFLPHSIGNLSSLKDWSLHTKNLLDLPTSIENLSSLENWAIFADSVIFLPESIGQLSSLRTWTLHANNTGSNTELGSMTSRQCEDTILRTHSGPRMLLTVAGCPYLDEGLLESFGWVEIMNSSLWQKFTTLGIPLVFESGVNRRVFVR